MSHESKNGALLVAVLSALIIGGAIGYVVSTTLFADDDTTTETKTITVAEDPVSVLTSSPANTRVTLNNALSEHVLVTSAALRAQYDGSSSADAAVTTVDENSEEVASLIGRVYGDDAETEFLELWRSHVGHLSDYVAAAKIGDENGTQAALDELATSSKDTADFLAEQNPNLAADEVQPLLQEHTDLVIESVNAYADGDTETTFKKQTAAVNQIYTLADVLTTAIVQQQADAS